MGENERGTGACAMGSSEPRGEGSSEPGDTGTGGLRTTLTAAGSAVLLAFVSVFFGWLPNPFGGDEGAREQARTPATVVVRTPAPVAKAPGLEVLARAFPEPKRIPAKFREGDSQRPGTVEATRLALTLRNRGDLEAVVTEFRFVVRTAELLMNGDGPSCLPKTGGVTEFTADYDVPLPDLGSARLSRPVVVRESHSVAAGDAERVLFTLGVPGDGGFYPVLYVVDIQLREGRESAFVPGGTVAFLTPTDLAAEFLHWSHAVAGSDTVLCDPSPAEAVDRAIARSDDHTAQLDDLKDDLDTLKPSAPPPAP